MGYFEKKSKHAYKCYKKGQPRKKVYAVVEKDGKFLVLSNKKNKKYKYCLAGGGIEKKENSFVAAKREILEELNVEAEVVKSLGVIKDKSKWTYKNKEFWVDDEMEIVYAKYVCDGKQKSIGIKGEFDKQVAVALIDRQDMLDYVAEFAYYGLKFEE